jgi:hypothetical protein
LQKDNGLLIWAVKVNYANLLSRGLNNGNFNTRGIPKQGMEVYGYPVEQMLIIGAQKDLNAMVHKRIKISAYFQDY